MAKLVGLIGTGRGRVGNVVLSKGLNGQTISRAYQPQVYNPNTPGQIESRAKMTLAGLLSKITPASALVGMNGATKTERRSRFVANICRRASVNAQNQAILAPADLVISEGNSFPIARPTTALADGVLQVSFTDEALVWPDELAGIMVVAYGSENRTTDFIEVAYGVATKTTPNVQISVRGNVVNVYIIPMVKKDGVADATYADAVVLLNSPLGGYGAAYTYVTAGVIEMRASEYIETVS